MVAAGVVVALLLVVATRYGYHRDELYFLAAGRHLAWGYVDQPALTPLLARIVDTLQPGSLAALHVLPALAAGAVVVLTGRLAALLGASRRGQVLAAVAAAGSTLLLTLGHLLSTTTFDVLLWTAVSVLVVRLLLGGSRLLWLPIGVLGGIAFHNKHTIVLLALGLAVGFLTTRRDLIDRWALGAAGIAVLIAAPNLAWQAANGWPQLEMAAALRDRAEPALVLPLLLLAPNLLLAPVWMAGLARCWRQQALRPLPVAFLTVLALVLVTGGKFYYVFGLFPVAFAAGAAAVQERFERRGRQLPARATAFAAAAGVLALPLGLPVLPLDVLAATPIPEINGELVETVGWPGFVAQVAAARDRIEPSRRGDVVLLTASYGEAGAIERYGRRHGLPTPYSAHNSYWGWAMPPDDAAPVLVIGYRAASAGRICAEPERLTTITMPADVPNEENGAPIWLCARPAQSWDRLWPALRHYN